MEKEKIIYWLTQIRKRQTGGKTQYDEERKEALDIAMAAVRQMKAGPCELCKYEDGSFPELCKKCPARKKEEPDG